MSDPRVFIQTEEQEEKDNIMDFKPKLITGGKGTGEDWLSPLPEGSVFFTQDGAKAGLMEWRINRKYKRAVMLLLHIPDGTTLEQPVDPISFCRDHKLYELVREGDEITE